MTQANAWAATCACGVSVSVGTGQVYEQAGRFRVQCARCVARALAKSGQSELPPILAEAGSAQDLGKVTFKTAKPAGWAYSVFAESCKRAGAQISKAMGPWSEFACSFEAASEVILELRGAGFRLEPSPDLVAQALARRYSQARGLEVTDTRLEAIEQELRARGKFLFGFQRVGAGWLGAHGPTQGGAGALLADDMGLGKTVQILAAIPVRTPALVICPAGGIGTWQREASAWRPDLQVRVVESTKAGAFAWPEPGELVICALKRMPKLIPGPPRPGTVVVIDEAHEIKNPKSIQGGRARSLCRLARELAGASWGADATPMLNRPDELWEVLDCLGIAREAYRTYVDFVRAFGGKRNSEGKLVYPGRPPAEAAQRLGRVMLRREKSEVLAQLPEKLWEAVQVRLPDKISAEVELLCQVALEKIKASGRDPDQALESLVAGDQIPGAAELAQANQMLALAKTERMLELVSDYELAETPLVVFSTHRAPIEALQGRPGWGAILGGGCSICELDGTVRQVSARVVEDTFQAGKLRGCAGTIRAMGTTYTLTRASNELWVDRPWTPGLEDQAEDRCYRIGQTRGVLIRRLVSSHPLEKKIARLLDMKRKIIEGSVSAARVGDLASASQLVAGPLDKLIKLLQER